MSHFSTRAPPRNIVSRRTVVLTDASLRGWGAVWKGKTVHGKWNSRCSGEHINVLGVRAVHLALLELLLLIWNRHLLVRTDHISVVILTGLFKVLLTAPMWPGRWWFPTLIHLLHEPLQPLPVKADLLSGGRVDLPVKSDNAMTVDMAPPQSFPLEEAVVQTIYRPGPCLHVTATANSGTHSQDGVTTNSWSLPHLHFKLPSITSRCQGSIQ